MRTIALLVAIAGLAGAGCVRSHGTVQLTPDMYMIYKSDSGKSADMAALKSQVIGEANEMAQSQGKAIVPITTYGSYVGFAEFTTFDYQFRLVDPGSPPTLFDPDKVKSLNGSGVP